MKEKKNKLENNSISNPETIHIISKKKIFFHELIQKTILHVQKNKTFDILTVNEVSNCLDGLNEINNKLIDLPDILLSNLDFFINNLQQINNDISTLLKNYGTLQLEDLLTICFGNNSIFESSENEKYKLELLKMYFHPISYKVITIKEVHENYFIIISESNNVEKINNIHCLDVIDNFKNFHMKVYGMKVYLFNSNKTKCILINGIVDDIAVDFIHNKYVQLKKREIKDNLPNQDIYKTASFPKFLSSLLLKDYLIYHYNGIYNKFSGYLSNINLLRQKTLTQIIKEFMVSDIFYKRLIIIQLIIKSDNQDSLYLSYLLYDLLSNDNNEKIDTNEQIILFDSFPWKIKNEFKNAMTKTIQYTTELLNYDINKVALEQQICLLNAPEVVKEKAIVKLKEIKGKSEDTGSKARLYLDGLLKIPFGIYRKEPVLNIMDIIRKYFVLMYNKFKNENVFKYILPKEKYTSIEISMQIKNILKAIDDSGVSSTNVNLALVETKINNCQKQDLVEIIQKINIIITNKKIKCKKMTVSKKKNSDLMEEIMHFIQEYPHPIINDLFTDENITSTTSEKKIEIKKDIDYMEERFLEVNNYINGIKTTLNASVYGHENAKKQIEIIIGQWINGEQDGYCFGFEGPPGVGKTSLAKRGLSKCLKDENDIERPFAMIQMGGDSNGSTLHGHNYTYIGSTWGSIVQILIDKKCMNPIIFIDEVDKISKTEHGKEIVGILTHLLDSTQNDCFQDKYFNGIDLDLSKALFILSYNDVDAIDKVLLDRIHRIKFDNLSTEDKIVICNKHLLPEIYKKMGLEDVVDFKDEVLTFIIENYTSEAGVRKLKEILFQIIGEINIDVLKNNNEYKNLPINVTIDDLKNKFFKEKSQIKQGKIMDESQIGIINALWANSLGQGGTLPIQASFVPSDKFLHLTLTGSQGDVMKETMNVALTMAWNLSSEENKNKVTKMYNDVKNNNIQGIHIHTPDCSTPKDGPSATAAITVAIYSLLNNVKIKNTFGITGELNFSGDITEIGGLEPKIIGSIKCGIKEFIYPSENQKDFEKFFSKYKNNDLIKDIQFHSVNKIEEVLNIILIK